jgi:hypothetical protein
LVWKYGIVKKRDGKVFMAEIYSNQEGEVIACFEVNVSITNQPVIHPEKASIEDVRQNFYQEIGNNKFSKIVF